MKKLLTLSLAASCSLLGGCATTTTNQIDTVEFVSSGPQNPGYTAGYAYGEENGDLGGYGSFGGYGGWASSFYAPGYAVDRWNGTYGDIGYHRSGGAYYRGGAGYHRDGITRVNRGAVRHSVRR